MNLEQTKVKRPMLYIYCVYLLCFLFRAIEYIFIRTDRSFIGEAFIHKTIGIIILAVVIRAVHYSWTDIGFQKRVAIRHTLLGLLLGICTFIIAYGAELIIQNMNGNSAKLTVYVSSFSLDGNNIMQTNVLFFAICIVGNIINVFMEEGIFRGLLIRLGEMKYSFIRSVFFASLLFGVWHIAAPVRELIDGNMQVGTAIIASFAQIIITGLMGIKLCLLVKITGSLWTAMADHFFNNFIVNILHVVAPLGMDELQIVRISIAQTISFIVVLLIYCKSKPKQQATFR